MEKALLTYSLVYSILGSLLLWYCILVSILIVTGVKLTWFWEFSLHSSSVQTLHISFERMHFQITDLLPHPADSAVFHCSVSLPFFPPPMPNTAQHWHLSLALVVVHRFTFHPSPQREHAVTRPGPWLTRSPISHSLQTLTDNLVASFTPLRHPPPHPTSRLLCTPPAPHARTHTHTRANIHTRALLLTSLLGISHLKKTKQRKQSKQSLVWKQCCGKPINLYILPSSPPLSLSLPRRPRTWTWLKRWSAWCWRSSTPACPTRSTTTPTWCTHCSTSESSLSSSGRTRLSRTSCKTWTRSVSLPLFPFSFLS